MELHAKMELGAMDFKFDRKEIVCYTTIHAN
jgi:hypothetical protein